MHGMLVISIILPEKGLHFALYNKYCRKIYSKWHQFIMKLSLLIVLKTNCYHYAQLVGHSAKFEIIGINFFEIILT